MRTDRELAQVIWDYMQVGQTPRPSDVILCLGSHDYSVAERAAELYLQKLAPNVLFSGGFGRLTKGAFAKTEAESFADIAIAAGVPEQAIIIEKASSNTGENIRFSYQLLQELRLSVRQMILVQKPYMERRTLATFEAQWPAPQPNFTVTSPQVSFADYCTKIPEPKVIHLMVGDLQRIREYPSLGFQSKQHIPDNVWEAAQELAGPAIPNIS